MPDDHSAYCAGEQTELFAPAAGGLPEELRPGAVLLRAFALAAADELVEAVLAVAARAPFRRMSTPGGSQMSVAITNCGECGWVSDRRGYRYAAQDPRDERPWPPLPAVILRLGVEAAQAAGFADFAPDACLINRYEVGARMSLHQDRNELDYTQPIVSVSLGIPATFLFGGPQRNDRPVRVPLRHGDVVVWGGPARRYFHGVLPVKPAQHPQTGALRYNLTLRRAR